MIKIVRGVYGFVDKYGIVRPKTEADAPFELKPEQEERLVRLGVAEYVGNVAAEQAPIDVEEPPVEDTTLSDKSVKELREIGKDYDLTFPVGTSKADMVKAIEAAQAELISDDDEPAPVFDVTEAVR